MTKRIISILTTLAMVVGIVANVNLSSYAKTNYSKIIDVDIYKAQCFAGIAKDEHSDAVKRCNELYNYYINENIHSPTQSFLDAVYEDQALMDDYNEWKLYSLAAEPSSALDLVMKKSDYYESLIISMFSKASQSDSEWQKFLNNKIINSSNKMLNTLCSIANVGQVSELVDNLNIKDSKTVGYVKQTVENYFPIGVASKVTGVVGDVLETAKDITDLVDKLSAYGSMVELDSSAKLWLEQMYNSCTSSTDTALKNALLNLKSSSTGFAKTALVMIKETSFSISNWAIKTAIDDGITALASTNPVVMAVCTGLKAGKTICNIFFNSDDVCEQLFLMECIYDVQDLSRNVAESCKNTFIKSQTKDNALTFTYAVDCYYESIINVDIDCMEDFLDKLYNGGILKELIKWIYGATDDYQECVNTLEGLRNARIDNKTLMISYYKAALRANYPETFEYYYVKDDTVAITGLSFSVSRIFPPGYPAGYADLLVGDFSNLDVQYKPSNTTQKGYNVISDNPDVIKVNGNVITAVSAGTAKITITSTDNPKIFYTKEIKVKEKLADVDNETLTSRFKYTIENNKATITGLASGYNPTSIKIPSKINGNTVTSIGYWAFEGCESLTSITIPNSVTSIGGGAFSDCSSLTEINIDSNNKNYSSQDGVLFDYEKTELIQYPIGKTKTSYTIPNSVTSIGNYAFDCCSNLTSITIPNNVISIGAGAFGDCENLISVTIPNSVTSIGEYAFSKTPWLEDKQKENPLVVINGILIDGTTCCGDITIPNSVTSIGKHAFTWCESLTSIIIPDSVTSIGDYAFLYCHSLTSITIPNSVTSIGDGAFSDCDSLTSITIPNSVISIGDDAFFGCDSLTSVTIPNSVTSIGEGAFEYCNSLTSVTIGNSVTSIGDHAFYYCDSLTSVTIGNSVTSIGDNAFDDCNSLTSVTIPNSVTSIGVCAFCDCTSLTSITIPYSVTSIGVSAFCNCTSLTSITIPYSVTSIGVSAFCNCYILTIKCFNGSYAEHYAIENDIKYELLDANPTVNPSEKPSQNSSNNPSQNPTNNSNNNTTNSSQNPNNNQSNKPNSNTNKQNPTTAPTTSKSPAIIKAKIKNLNAKAKGKKITVSWKKIKIAKGYQVQAATNKKFKKKQIVFDKKTKKKKITIKGNKIKKNRIYYIRVRAYTTGKNANGKPKYTYSKWTKKKVMTR